MKALVLGAGGFIGNELFNRLKADNRFTDVIGQSRKYRVGLSSRSPVYILTEYKPDVVFNCSGHSTPTGDVDDMFFDNVTDLVHVLSNINQTNPPIFVHLSSIVVDNKPLTSYAASKLCGEVVVQSFTELGKIKGVVLRPCSVNGLTNHGLVHDIAKKIKENPKKIEVLAKPPGAYKPFILVDDLVAIMINLAFNPNTLNSPLTISSPDSLSVERVINIIMDTLNIYPELDWVGVPWIDQMDVKPGSNYLLRCASDVVEIATKRIWEKINVL